MVINAQMVKELREKTGAGMMDCKKALVEVNGDMDKAVDWLRQKGIAKAAKKSGRATCEGLITAISSNDGKHVAMSSLMCETDFVARGDQFQNMAKRVAQAVLDHNPADAAALDGIVGEEVKSLIASIGENMKAGRFIRHSQTNENEVIGQYVHHNGKIGVLVFLTVGNKENLENPQVQTLAEQIAMQVAFSNPLSLDVESLDPNLIEHEKEIYRQKAREEGKPENIIEKIAEGAVKKFEQQVCLVEQPFFMDEKKTIGQLVKDTAKTLGESIRLTGYERLQLGQE